MVIYKLYVCTEALDALVEGQDHPAHSLPNQAAGSHSKQGDGETFRVEDYPKKTVPLDVMESMQYMCHSRTFLCYVDIDQFDP